MTENAPKTHVLIVTAPHPDVSLALMLDRFIKAQKRQNPHWEYKVVNFAQEIPAEAIQQADVVIVLSDVKLNLSAFKGKNVYKTSPLKFFQNSAEEFAHALEKAEIYTGDRNEALVEEALQETDTKLGKCAVKSGAHRTAIIVLGGLVLAALIFYFK